jgi:dynein heavy chain
LADITLKSEYYTKIALQCERNQPKNSTAVQTLKKLVFDFRETIPIVEALGNKNLKVEHWTDIKNILNLPSEYPMEER